MKLRTAIRKAKRVFVQASYNGTPICFHVSKAEVLRVLATETRDLDLDLDDEDNWSLDEGCHPYWIRNNLILSYT